MCTLAMLAHTAIAVILIQTAPKNPVQFDEYLREEVIKYFKLEMNRIAPSDSCPFLRHCMTVKDFATCDRYLNSLSSDEERKELLLDLVISTYTNESVDYFRNLTQFVSDHGADKQLLSYLATMSSARGYLQESIKIACLIEDVSKRDEALNAICYDAFESHANLEFAMAYESLERKPYSKTELLDRFSKKLDTELKFRRYWNRLNIDTEWSLVLGIIEPAREERSVKDLLRILRDGNLPKSYQESRELMDSVFFAITVPDIETTEDERSELFERFHKIEKARLNGNWQNVLAYLAAKTNDCDTVRKLVNGVAEPRGWDQAVLMAALECDMEDDVAKVLGSGVISPRHLEIIARFARTRFSSGPRFLEFLQKVDNERVRYLMLAAAI